MKDITSKQLRDKFSDVLNEVAFKDERYTVSRNGKEMAVIISLEDYLKAKAYASKLEADKERKAPT